MPKAEGSLQSLETKMSIGVAALTRYLNKQSEIRVVVPDRNNDTPLVKEMKSIVEAMTCFSPEARLAAEEVEERMDSLARKVSDHNATTPLKHKKILIANKIQIHSYISCCISVPERKKLDIIPISDRHDFHITIQHW